MKIASRFILFSLVIFLLAISPSSAQFINGNFSLGLQNWTYTGSTSYTTSSTICDGVYIISPAAYLYAKDDIDDGQTFSSLSQIVYFPNNAVSTFYTRSKSSSGGAVLPYATATMYVDGVSVGQIHSSNLATSAVYSRSINLSSFSAGYHVIRFDTSVSRAGASWRSTVVYIDTLVMHGDYPVELPQSNGHINFTDDPYDIVDTPHYYADISAVSNMGWHVSNLTTDSIVDTPLEGIPLNTISQYILGIPFIFSHVCAVVELNAGNWTGSQFEPIQELDQHLFESTDSSNQYLSNVVGSANPEVLQAKLIKRTYVCVDLLQYAEEEYPNLFSLSRKTVIVGLLADAIELEPLFYTDEVVDADYAWHSVNTTNFSYTTLPDNLHGSMTNNTSLENVDGMPVLASIGSKSVNETALLQFSVSASGPSGISYNASGIPSGAIFNSTHVFSWTPSYNQSGVYYVTFTAAANGVYDSETVAITVNNVDRVPVLASIGSKSVNENVSLEFSVSATDPDGDSITYSASGLPSGASINAASGAFTWTPSFTQSGVHSVTFTATANGVSDSETVTITVSNIDLSPVLSSIGSKSVNENVLLAFSISATDPDGDSIIYSASNLPSGASLNPSTGAFSWTPSSTQSGTYYVTFSANSNSLSDSEIVTITVGNVDLLPVLTSIGARSVDEGLLLQFTISATDPDGDTITYSASNLPSGASLNPSSGAFSWTPSSTQSGIYYVTFSASSKSLSDSEIVTITVGNIGHPPVLMPIGSKMVNPNVFLQFILLATDSDGDTITYSASNLPSGASLNPSTGAFSWTPSSTQSGVYSVSFAATSNSLTDSETVTITVITPFTNTTVFVPVNNSTGTQVPITVGNNTTMGNEYLGDYYKVVDGSLSGLSSALGGFLNLILSPITYITAQLISLATSVTTSFAWAVNLLGGLTSFLGLCMSTFPAEVKAFFSFCVCFAVVLFVLVGGR